MLYTYLTTRWTLNTRWSKLSSRTLKNKIIKLIFFLIKAKFESFNNNWYIFKHNNCCLWKSRTEMSCPKMIWNFDKFYCYVPCPFRMCIIMVFHSFLVSCCFYQYVIFDNSSLWYLFLHLFAQTCQGFSQISSVSLNFNVHCEC